MKLALLCTLLVFAGASSSGWSPRMLVSARELWAITLCSMPLVCCEDKQLETQTLGPGVIPTQGGILNLNKMIKQVTRKTPIFSYWPYGCHCGLGGKGQPKDASDWCCRNHDCCYAHLRQHRCHIHTDNYDYTFSQGDIQCSDKGSWCEQQLCACDKEVAFCLKRNLETYKRHLRYYWRPHCRGQTPTC